MIKEKESDMSEPRTKTARSVFPVSINAPVDRVFPLVCPVEEYRWIPGWKCNLVNCPGDRAELGTVFEEIFSAPFLIGSFRGTTTWTVVAHDPESHKIHFRLDNGISSSVYRVELEDNGEGGTIGTLDFTYKAINRKGNRLIAKNMEGKLHIMLSMLNAMLQHYCESGEMLSFPALQKIILSEERLSLWDKVRLGLNRIAVSRMKDSNRGRFMREFVGALG
jgi:hypothetical protein